VLLERKLRADDNARAAHEALLLALLDAAELEGASRRELAAVLGVGTTTVQTWLKQAERLRAS
jgi:transposase